LARRRGTSCIVRRRAKAACRVPPVNSTLCARIQCTSFREAPCTAHCLRSPSKYPRRASVLACAAMGPRLKFIVAVAMRHHVFHPGTTVVSVACDRRRVWLVERASRLTSRPAQAPMHVGASLWWASAASVPCSGAARSFAAQRATVRGSVDGAAHNLAVEATSTGWPHMASCSFLPCAASR
jgi:hypothetical protein